jgi:phenylpyruvate tautomerase PptA (4-oxalocrotonate tautomerase family)
MPFYQFTVPADSAAARKKAEVAAAVTAAHAEVTGAPSQYLNCSFVEVPPGSIFVADTPVEADRMVGLIRQGRSEEAKRKLITALAEPGSRSPARRSRTSPCSYTRSPDTR